MNKKFINFSLLFLLLFPMICFAEGVEQLREQTNVVKQIILDNDMDNYFAYIVKIPNGNDVYFSGMASVCSIDDSTQDKIAQMGTELVKNYYSDWRVESSYLFTNSIGRFMEYKSQPDFKAVSGRIKPVHEYICNNYRNNINHYNDYLNKANELKEKKDYKSAIEQYNNAINYAQNLSQNGYSIGWQAKAYILLGDLYSEMSKYAKAKENYTKVLTMEGLKNKAWQEKVNDRISKLPTIKGEKAKNVAGSVLNGIGTVGTGALMLLMSN